MYCVHIYYKGISFANLSNFEEASKAYVQALHLTPGARHIWGYLRVVFTSMNKLDLVEMSSQENTKALGDELKISLIDPL
jgi:methyl coenzyme M reductase subunit C